MNDDVLARDYRCSRCWGALVLKYFDDHKDHWQVVCAKDPTHEGYVTAHFVNSRRHMDALESAEVGSAFAKILNLHRPDLKAASRALYGSDD